LQPETFTSLGIRYESLNMAYVIIGIHGLGNKPPVEVLEDWWKLAMLEGLNTHNYSALLPEFEMVFWADILHEDSLDMNEKDVNSPLYSDEQYVKAPEYFPVEDRSKRRIVVDYLGRQISRMFLNEDLSLNYSAITDTVISRYFRDLKIYYSEDRYPENSRERNAKELIRERLYDILLKHKDDEIMLVGHSMGTIIAYDVLSFMAPDIKINTFVTIGSPLSFPVIISKIASEQKERGINNIRIKTPEAITKNWFNFSDILDKVAFNYKLSNDFSENSYGIKPIDFLVINNYEIEGRRNPHKSFGYLRTPEFSNVLNNFIQSERITAIQKIVRWFTKFMANLRSKILSVR